MQEVCRTCLKLTSNLVNLFEDNELPHKIVTISSVMVELNDNLPSKLCEECTKNIHLLYDFRNIIIRSDLILRERQALMLKREEQDNVNNTIVECIPDIKPEEVYVEDVNVEVKEEVIYACNLCEFVCSEHNQLKNHKRRHTRPRSMCNVCGKTMRADNLGKHIISHNDDPVTCDTCGKSYKNSEALRFHLRVHKKVTLQCNTCGKIYTSRATFRVHQKRHSLGDAKTVKCELCDKLFYAKKSLAKHIRSHTGERPYPCEFCNKGFSSSNALKTHRRQHTKEKPFACQLCPMAFPQRVSLRTHIKSKHQDSTFKSPPISSINI